MQKLGKLRTSNGKMSAKVSDVFFIRKRNATAAMLPQVVKVEDGKYIPPKFAVSTMAESLSPLLTSMKVFGLYFQCGTSKGDRKPCRKWNYLMIHSLIGVILAWINVVRMFSVFTLK